LTGGRGACRGAGSHGRKSFSEWPLNPFRATCAARYCTVPTHNWGTVLKHYCVLWTPTLCAVLAHYFRVLALKHRDLKSCPGALHRCCLSTLLKVMRLISGRMGMGTCDNMDFCQNEPRILCWFMKGSPALTVCTPLSFQELGGRLLLLVPRARPPVAQGEWVIDWDNAEVKELKGRLGEAVVGDLARACREREESNASGGYKVTVPWLWTAAAGGVGECGEG